MTIKQKSGEGAGDPHLLDGLEEFVDLDCLVVSQKYNFANEHLNFFNDFNNKIVVMLLLGEYNMPGLIDEILSKNKNKQLKNYYIFVSPHNYPDYLFEQYKDFFTLIVNPYLYSYYSNHIDNINFIKTEKKLHFLSLNNRCNYYRQTIFYFFEKFSLTQKSYFSYHCEFLRSNFTSLDEITNTMFNGLKDNPWYIKGLDFNELNKKIPLTIPSDNFSANDWTQGTDFFYKDTFCSLYTETYDSQQFPFMTEKTFKPIAFYHPFLAFANKNTLKQLQSLGFKTFDKFWDEDYDQLEGNKRLEAIFHIVLEIANWSIEKMNNLHEEMIPILEHNHNHLFYTLPKIYASESEKMFDQIKQIAHEKRTLLT